MPVRSLETGLGLRDEHMRNYIFTTADGQMPDVRFSADRAECVASDRGTTCTVNENYAVPRPALRYDPPVAAPQVFVNTALLHHRASDSLEFAIGRDQLPTGINVPDLGLFIKGRHRLGYYDAPTQVKAAWARGHFQVTPFAYGPGGNEPAGERERGAGSLAEFDVLGRQGTVVGVTVQRADSPPDELQRLRQRLLADAAVAMG